MRKFLGWAIAVASFAFLGVIAEAGEKKIRVLILDGQNNHSWKATTPIM